MIAKEYTLTEPNGMHARPAAALIKIARKYTSLICIAKDNRPVKLNSMLNLMTLGAKQGDILHVTIEGEDEEQASQEIETFFKTTFSTH
ncbi:HPr family phosphocarrier protein [Marinilongibacter aquaticus]|uniref:HPr family phosphocarrier protein n=1 Tax=Marinilongibacter aquaticus TaxID=2975157 RepID=UPI0021BD98DB|nr:HPr family phosphocarrier protein [Marinilongibacter aquaticus]UBM58011.1 HPr family phosphocarrier protein [Marinilongibacter aquaticus]